MTYKVHPGLYVNSVISINYMICLFLLYFKHPLHVEISKLLTAHTNQTILSIFSFQFTFGKISLLSTEIIPNI